MLYIFNSNEELLTVLSNASGRAPALWNPIHKENLAGENSFSFMVPADNDAAQYITEGNLVAWKDLDNIWQMFEIKRKVDDHGEKLTRYVECEHVAYELLDEFSLLFTSGSTTSTIPGPDNTTITVTTPILVTATEALTTLLAGTRWTPGTITVTETHSFAYPYDNVYSLLKSLASLWQGEVQHRMTIVNGIITGRYVDLLIQRGQDRGKQFVYGKDTKNIERDIDIGGVVTALYGKGKDGITFKDVVWTTPTNPANKPAGQLWVGDPVALTQWGRANGTRHRYNFYENTTQDVAASLLVETWNDLQKRKILRASYVLKVAVLETSPGYVDEKTRIGDTVRGIDKSLNPPLLVSIRVVEIVRDILQLENTEVTLGTYKPSIILDLVEQRQQNAATTAVIVETILPPPEVVSDLIPVGSVNATGQCHMNTYAGGFRFQAHIAGNYFAYFDDGSMEFFVNNLGIASITNGGKFLGASAAITDINYAADALSFDLIEDGSTTGWTLVKDASLRITKMTNDKGRVINVNY